MYSDFVARIQKLNNHETESEEIKKTPNFSVSACSGNKLTSTPEEFVKEGEFLVVWVGGFLDLFLEIFCEFWFFVASRLV